MTPDTAATAIVNAFHKRGNTGLTQLEYDISAALDAAALRERERLLAMLRSGTYQELARRLFTKGKTK